MGRKFTLSSLAFFTAIIAPAFSDITPQDYPFRGSLNEFTLMDLQGKRSAGIVNIRGTQNILQRRDASCDINYKRVMGTDNRRVTIDEFYGATKLCRNEFYQGCMKDFRAKDPVFGNLVLPFFIKAIMADVTSNAYFGNVLRPAPVNAVWSTDVFDGVFNWYKRYIAAGVIAAGQTLTIADGTDYQTTPAAAHALLAAMYAKQTVLMGSWIDTDKAFYVSKEIAAGLEDYYISVGMNAAGYTLLLNGIPTLKYKGIPVLVEPTWTPIISQIKGSTGYAAILTIRGNFIFAYDSLYGEGADGRTALEVWYNEDEMTWKYRYFIACGTQLGLPEHSVIALSSWT